MTSLDMGARRRRPASKFRPEVQALRAVAVLGVVLYHLWPSYLRGGFVGVDVFFVISGFLITQQLVAESHQATGVALTEFWARRVRRIIPAALVVLLASIALVVFAMPRLTWRTNLSDIGAAAAYFENWQLGNHAVDYLSASNAPTVVQHYWSLSVEEQFYLAWPLLIAGTVAAVRRVHRARLNNWLFLVLGTIAVGSLATSVLWTSNDPTMAFFATPTRAWEFASGGLVAVAVTSSSRMTARARSLLSWAGLAVVAASMCVVSRHSNFPGWVALLPVSGAMMVVAADLSAATAWSPERAARTRLVQWIGNNSYSIYLWHWPLIIAGPWIIGRSLTAPWKAVIFVVSMGLADITRRLVEDPVRKRAIWRARRWPAYALAGAGVATVVVVTGTLSDHVSHQDQKALVAAETRSAALVVEPGKQSCFGAAAMVASNGCSRPFARPADLDTAFAADDGRNDPCLESNNALSTPVYCVFGQKHHPQETIAVIGNSHAWRLIPALSLYGKHHGWRIIEVSRINCLGLITRAAGPDGATSSCLAWADQVERHLLAMHGLTGVVFASYRYWQEFTAGQDPTSSEVADTKRQIIDMWGHYRDRGVRVFAVQDVPGMRHRLDPQCIAQSRARYDPCPEPRSKEVRSTVVTELAKQYPSLATFVPIDQYFCDHRQCHALIGGVVVYFDDHHMTSTFSRSLAQYLGSEIAMDFATPRPSA